jgi:hypothetical protein
MFADPELAIPLGIAATGLSVVRTVQDFQNPDSSGLTRGLDIATDLVGFTAVIASGVALARGVEAADAAADTTRISGYAGSLVSRDSELAEQAYGVLWNAVQQEEAAEASLAQWLSWSKAGGWAANGLEAAGLGSSWFTDR